MKGKIFVPLNRPTQIVEILPYIEKIARRESGSSFLFATQWSHGCGWHRSEEYKTRWRKVFYETQ